MSKTAQIHLRQVEHYRLEEVEDFVRAVVDGLPAGTFGPGLKVLLKPNLLRALPPERCVTTHPVVVEAVCRVLKDAGVADIHISDSPALGSMEYAARKSGYTPLIKRYGVALTPLAQPVPFETEEGVPFLKIAGTLSHYDRIVNLPKFKSHQQMTLTLAIKNLFGCVIGKRKPVLHCLVQNDKIKFGKMLVDIARHVNPCLTIVDGIQAMQGNGPISGNPYPLHVLAGGSDMTALERVLAELVNIPPAEVYALEAARLKNFGVWDLDRIDILGVDNWRALAVSDFKRAGQVDISFNPLRVAKSIAKQIFEIGWREKVSS
jgi:uncharacterized protein (DUF362 family)